MRILPIQTTMQLVKICNKFRLMNYLENLYIRQRQLQGSLIDGQSIGDLNSLFILFLESNS